MSEQKTAPSAAKAVPTARSATCPASVPTLFVGVLFRAVTVRYDQFWIRPLKKNYCD